MTVGAFKKFRKDQRGNLSVTTALVGVMLLTAVGATMDGGRMITTKQQLQAATDAAALMAAMPEGISDQKRRVLAQKSIDDYASRKGNLDLRDPVINVRNSGEQVSVQLTADVPMLFGAFLGGSSRAVRVSSTAEETETHSMSAISISVILDLSESMTERLDSGSKLANVKAALSDTFKMIESRFGGKAAAETQFSTGLYPFNWGMVDGEVVALEPGTTNVLDALNFMATYEGSVPSESFELAVADQLAATGTEGTRERYLVYITDGDVDDEKADERGQYLPANEVEAAENSPVCKAAEEDLDRAKRHLVNTNENALNNFGKTGGDDDDDDDDDGGSLLPGLSYLDKNQPVEELIATAKKTLSVVKPLAPASSRHIPRLEEDLEEIEVYQREATLACKPKQTMRVLDACADAKDNDLSLIAIDMSGDEGQAAEVLELCTGIVVNPDQPGDEARRTQPNPNAEALTKTETISKGGEIHVSGDGKSVSATISDLSQLRDVLATMLPEAGQGERTVRLIN